MFLPPLLPSLSLFCDATLHVRLGGCLAKGEESAQLNKQVLFPSASLLGPPPTYIDVEEEEIERTDVLFESYGLYDVG